MSTVSLRDESRHDNIAQLLGQRECGNDENAAENPRPLELHSI